ncbi:LLM class flavin-dependent oxidoreductase [Clavibacter capsici]|uniref:LLM class flavin-dependent oxidoreductase n=1 Tax=Clavibacter capsici TaxID=1874630 RepID=A0AAE6XNE0_9MICO|nr:LLM class flavin-dependent oxidoreductase [Clavibacter capsici]QIS44087.1 LLM class flavin-dependent oxidoreductase [Clavibacter capsici]
MPASGTPLKRIGFLTIGTFDPADPAAGHETTLRVIERGEQLGFDSAWLRHRHLQHGISSPVAVMAAASQRTSRIHLGTAVTPIGAENPFRLAEDLATVDLLTGGRLQPGFSAGTPMSFDRYRDAIYPDTLEQEELGYDRLLRFRDHVRGDAVDDRAGREGQEEFASTVQPHATGLVDRLWYGAGGVRSAVWAAENGFHLLASSVTEGMLGNDFATNQRAQIDAYRAAHPRGAEARVSQGLVVIPTDRATPEQVARYEAYAASRAHRVGVPIGPRRMLFAADLVGTSEEIAATLHADAGYQAVDEVAFALPFTFGEADLEQILTDVAERLGPALGWSPATA